jgi:16S rRNA processing protein RimM
VSAGGKAVCLGVIVGVKGLKGEVKIKTFTEVPEDIAAYGPLRTAQGRTLAVSVLNAVDDVVTARVAGVSDRTAAEALKGLELFVDRTALPAPEDGTFYHTDLIGLAVAVAAGEVVGKVVAFHNYGGGDVMEVEETQGHKTALLPFTADVIAEIDLAGGKVVINPMPGLFDDAGPDGDGEEADGHAA